jgi:hypothetical protein
MSSVKSPGGRNEEGRCLGRRGSGSGSVLPLDAGVMLQQACHWRRSVAATQQRAQLGRAGQSRIFCWSDCGAIMERRSDRELICRCARPLAARRGGRCEICGSRVHDGRGAESKSGSAFDLHRRRLGTEIVYDARYRHTCFTANRPRTRHGRTTLHPCTLVVTASLFTEDLVPQRQIHFRICLMDLAWTSAKHETVARPD